MAVGSAIVRLLGTVIGAGASLYGQAKQDKALASAGREARALSERERQDRLRSERQALGLSRENLELSRASQRFAEKREKQRQKEWGAEFAHRQKYDRANHLLGLINNQLNAKRSVSGMGFQRRG